jgi:serine protease Do
MLGVLRAGEAPSPIDVVRQLNQAFIEVAEKVSPSVVVVSVAHRPDFEAATDESNPWWDMLPPQFRDQLRERFRREPNARRQHPPVFDGQGSGVVIREDGYIVTNGHVVEGADKIKVRFKSGKEYSAEVRGVDLQSDVAVLKIDAKGLKAVKFANSDKVRVGEFAVAIGAPFELDYSVTIGHVSAKGRSRVIPDPAMDQDFIQTDASINPGNSGGPLVNVDGEIVGINTLIRGLRTGIGFAIPSNLANEVSGKLIADGKYTRAWLGVAVVAIQDDEELRDMLKGTETGVVVRRIEKDSPAAKSELKTGDVIATVDGRPVGNAQDLRNEIRARGVGTSVTLDVIRSGKAIQIKVKPEEWPEEARAKVSQTRPAPGGEEKDLGMVVKPATKELAREHGVEMVEGLLVTQVEAGSLAERKGVQKGDVMTEINQTPVTTLRAYREALKDVDVKKGVLLNLVRDGVSRLVVLKDTGE